MNLTEQESIFCQALAMTSLLGELSNKDFLNSDYYNENITFIGNNDNLKKNFETHQDWETQLQCRCSSIFFW